jgi:hypothetical protein
MNNHRQKVIAVLVLLLTLQITTGIRVAEASGFCKGIDGPLEDCRDVALVGNCYTLENHGPVGRLCGQEYTVSPCWTDLFGPTYRRPPPSV